MCLYTVLWVGKHKGITTLSAPSLYFANKERRLRSAQHILRVKYQSMAFMGEVWSVFAWLIVSRHVRMDLFPILGIQSAGILLTGCWTDRKDVMSFKTSGRTGEFKCRFFFDVCSYVVLAYRSGVTGVWHLRRTWQREHVSGMLAVPECSLASVPWRSLCYTHRIGSVLKTIVTICTFLCSDFLQTFPYV